jgi:hypothetical protein
MPGCGAMHCVAPSCVLCKTRRVLCKPRHVLLPLYAMRGRRAMLCVTSCVLRVLGLCAATHALLLLRAVWLDVWVCVRESWCPAPTSSPPRCIRGAPPPATPASTAASCSGQRRRPPPRAAAAHRRHRRRPQQWRQRRQRHRPRPQVQRAKHFPRPYPALPCRPCSCVMRPRSVQRGSAWCGGGAACAPGLVRTHVPQPVSLCALLLSPTSSSTHDTRPPSHSLVPPSCVNSGGVKQRQPRRLSLPHRGRQCSGGGDPLPFPRPVAGQLPMHLHRPRLLRRPRGGRTALR